MQLKISLLILCASFASSNWKWDAAKSSFIICLSEKWATSHLLEQYFVTVLYKYRLARSRPLICLRTNCDVKRKCCGDIRVSLYRLGTKNWKAMNLEYKSWLNMKVKCLSIISQYFLFCFYIVHVLIRGSFISCYNSLVS